MIAEDCTLDGYNNAYPIDMFDMSFRLSKTKVETVNLELLLTTNRYRFYKTIGFFRNEKIFLLNEFYNDYNKLINNSEINIKVEFLDIESSALIGAFSLITVGYSLDMIDKFKFDGKPFDRLENYDLFSNINGLKCELLLCDLGYPQLFLDDIYGIEGNIAAYIPTEKGFEITWPENFKNLIDELKELELLTVFNDYSRVNYI